MPRPLGLVEKKGPKMRARMAGSMPLPAMVDLQQRIDEKPLHVSADGTQIEQVLMNLCTNAWHSLPGGSGRIVVGLDIAMLDTTAAQRLGLPATGGYAHLWVGDTV